MGEPFTKERLETYLGLTATVECYNDRIARMESEEQFPAMKVSDGSQHQPGAGDRLERAIIRRMEYEEKMAPLINSARAEIQAIDNAVNALTNPLERLVLRLRYLEGDNTRPMKWEDVALKVYGDDDYKFKRSVERLGNKALEHINKKLKKSQK